MVATKTQKPTVRMRRTHLDLHALGLDDVDLVLVAAPNLVVDHSHAADGVMRPAEVHQVVVGQIPLAVCPPNHTHTRIIGRTHWSVLIYAALF